MRDAYAVNTASFCPYCADDARADFAVFNCRGAQVGKFCQIHAQGEVRRLNQEADRKMQFQTQRGH